HRRITVELSLGHVALLRRLSGAEGEASFGRVIEVLLDADDRRVRDADRIAAEIADILEPLSDQPCDEPLLTIDGEVDDDCGECASCLARAAWSMLVDLRQVLAGGKPSAL
ncbi:MAG: hypothetical protein DYG90_13250, partial [Chloroflexi bacterium CFX6]|nr:hypothetical protein [Chloroflexi bacterium CFX6]